MKIKDIYESTTSGSIATEATPLGKTQTRAGKLFKGKKTNKPFYEDEVNEADLILVPGHGKKIKPGFIPKDKDRTDHEVEMARSDLYQAAKNAQTVYKLIQDVSEEQGLEGWVQEKIIKANDYLNTIREYLEHKTYMQEMTGGVLAGGMSNFEESVTEGSMNAAQALRDFNAMAKVKDSNTYNGIKEAGHTDKIINAISACSAFVNHFKNNKDLNSAKIFDTLRSELIAFKNGDITTLYDLIQRGTLDKINFEEGVNEISDFKRKELEWELRNEPKNNYQVSIDGRAWKVFADKAHAEAVARKLNVKGKKATVHPTGASVSEEQLDEKKDACYNKVKSRYKVWPSAYASGALVKCRKVGASNWGNSSKK